MGDDVTIVSTRGQVVIPQGIRKRLRLKPKDRLIVFGEGDTIIMKKLELPELKETFVKMSKIMKQKEEGSDLLGKIKEKSIPVLKSNGIKKAAIFGSVARGEAGKTSDVDFLIEFKKERPTLFDMGGLKGELEEKLKRSVDLVLFRSIDPRLRERILKERVDIL